jgi:hypothetical protein
MSGSGERREEEVEGRRQLNVKSSEKGWLGIDRISILKVFYKWAEEGVD